MKSCLTVLRMQDIQGHALCLDISSKLDEFHVIAVYAPPDGNQCESFFDTIATWILPGQTYVLGDFNSVTDPTDRVSGKLDVTSSLLYDLLSSNELLEPPGGHTFTYQHPSVANRKSRIDRIYVPCSALDHSFTYTQWCQCSDHLAVVMAPCKKEKTLDTVEISGRCTKR